MSRAGGRLLAGVSWLLVGGLFVAPLTLGRLQEERDLWAHIALCVLLAGAGVAVALAQGPLPRWRATDGLLLALAVAYLLSSLRTTYPRATLAELLRLADYLALYLLVRVLCRREPMLLAATGALGAGAAACAAMGIQEYLITGLKLHDWGWRAFGPFFNPNLLAATLVMAIPLWLSLFAVAQSWAVRLLCGFALVLCWAGVFLTGSKGGALSLLGALLVAAVLAPDPARPGAFRRAGAGVALACLALGAALLLPPIKARLAAALGTQSNSTMFRYHLWTSTWRMALARPVLGFGPGTFGSAYPRFAVVGHTRLAHETYLQVAAETGFLGAAALVAALVGQVASGVAAARRSQGSPRTVAVAATAGMVGFCLHNTVDYGWHVTAAGMGFWALAGLVGAAWEGAAETPPPAAQEAPSRKRKGQARATEERVGRPLLAPLFLAAAALLAIIPTGLALGAKRLVRTGDEAGAAGLYPMAQDHYRAAMRLDPLGSEPHQRAALLAEQRGLAGDEEALARAAAEWRFVRRLRPTYAAAPYHLGRIAEARGDTEGALEQYSLAVALDAVWTEALVAQARLLERAGREDEALAVSRRLDELSRSPLSRYRAVENDLDPNPAFAWVALGDREPEAQARERYVEAARYLRRVAEADRALEGVRSASGEGMDLRARQATMAELGELVARRHLRLREPGPRLRAALLLVDTGQPELAKEFFAGPPGQGEDVRFLGRVIDGWLEHVQSRHLAATGNEEAAKPLAAAAAETLGEALRDRAAMSRLREGKYGWSEEETGALVAAAERG